MYGKRFLANHEERLLSITLLQFSNHIDGSQSVCREWATYLGKNHSQSKQFLATFSHRVHLIKSNKKDHFGQNI